MSPLQTLLGETSIIEEFIEKHCEFHCHATYNDKLYSLNIDKGAHRNPKIGIYFFVVETADGMDIMKVGKADGEKGFYGRFGKYSGDLTKQFEERKMDAPTLYYGFKSIRERYRKDAKLSVYIHQMTTNAINYHGISVENSFIRSFEKEMSQIATNEGNSMFLSKCA